MVLKSKTLSAETCENLELVQAKSGADLSRFPDFLILGPQRTGTSWLNSHLKVHPEIFLPKEKETYFFSTLLEPERPNFEYPSLEDYTSLAMRESLPQRWRKKIRARWVHGKPYTPKFFGDATASYATLKPEVIREICLINPEIKAILTLRDPQDRVWSHAKKNFTQHTDSTIDEIDSEDLDRFLRAGGQQDRSIYSAIIANWSEHLKPGNLLVAEFRLVREDPDRLLAEVLRFIGAEHKQFTQRRSLDAKVYATEKTEIPDELDQRIQDLFSAADKDYRQVIQELADHELSQGIYQI